MRSQLPAIAFPPHGPVSDATYLGRDLLEDGTGGGKQTYSGNLHQLLFGPSDIGKGMRVLVPNLVSIFGRSLVVLDPKGQLAAMTALYRHHMGDEVHIIDPFGVIARFAEERSPDYDELVRTGLVESAGFNPLAMLDPRSSTFYDEAAAITSALIDIETSEPHWPKSARALVTGLIMWEREQYGSKANLGHVYQMLTEADKSKEVNGRSVQIEGLRFHARAMVQNGSFAVKSLASRFVDSATNDEIESIKSTAMTALQWLLSTPMRRDLRKNTVDFRRLKSGPRPVTIYAVLPAKYLEDHSIWLRLFITSALRACLQSDNARKVLFIMDEFPALGHLEAIQKMWGVARDYGVAFYAILQDYGQLKRLYPKSYMTMMSSTRITQFFRPNDPETADYVSSRSPPDTLTVLSYNQGTGLNDQKTNSNQGLSESQVEKRSILPHWLYALPDDITVSYVSGSDLPGFLVMPHAMTQLPAIKARCLPNPYYNVGRSGGPVTMDDDPPGRLPRRGPAGERRYTRMLPRRP